MRTLKPLLAGMLGLVLVSVLPAAVVAQDEDPAAATSDPPTEVTVVGYLGYATGAAPDDTTELSLYHVAAASEDAPIVVDVGGTVDARALAERGVSVFVVSYPWRWEEVKPDANPTAMRAMVEAVACAVRFARGSEYGSETAPLLLTGFSAHGAAAAHVALAGDDFDRLWHEYEASAGGPPAQYDCTVTEGSTRVDGLVGVAGAYDVVVGYDGSSYRSPYGRDFLLEHEPELWEMLWGTVGLHPDLRIRLIHGQSDDVIPFESSAVFETVLEAAGYDVEMIAFEGGHVRPSELATETVMGLID